MRFSKALFFPIPKPHSGFTALDLASATLCIPDNSFLHPVLGTEQVGDQGCGQARVWQWSCPSLPAACPSLIGERIAHTAREHTGENQGTFTTPTWRGRDRG